jgi:hypothetical protein
VLEATNIVQQSDACVCVCRISVTFIKYQNWREKESRARRKSDDAGGNGLDLVVCDHATLLGRPCVVRRR